MFSSLTAVHCAGAIAGAFDKTGFNCDVELDLPHLEQLGLLEKVGLWRKSYEERLAGLVDQNAQAIGNVSSDRR